MENQKKLVRPREGRKMTGVCAAFAYYLSLDVTLVRVVYALLSLFTVFVGVIAYIILSFVIPEEA